MGCNQFGCSSSNQIQSLEVPCSPQQIGHYLNDIRANPTKYADLLEAEMQKFLDEYNIPLSQDVLFRANQGKEVWAEAVDFLRRVIPLPPLQLHEGLTRAAQLHAIDLSRQRQISHEGSNGSSPLDRLCKFCKKSNGKTGETIGTDFKLKNRNFAENTVVGLVIDDGVSDRGHRLSVFDREFAFYGSATRIQGDKVITVINYLSKNWELLLE